MNRLLRDEELRKFKSKNLLNSNYNQAVRNLAENPRKKEWFMNISIIHQC